MGKHGARGNSYRPPPGEPADSDGDCMSGAIFLAVLLLFIGVTAWGVMEAASESLDYTVAITGVSGLDPTEGLLNPEFNLSISIKSAKARCIAPRTSIKVSYSHPRVQMAAGRVPDDLCTGSEPRQVVARGHGVALPGFTADSLAEDMRRGDAMFEVVLMSLEPDNDRAPWKIVTCWAMLDGDAKMPCIVTWERIQKQDTVPAVAGPQ